MGGGTSERSKMTERQLEKALAKLESEVREGLRHGFFDYRVRCEIVTVTSDNLC